MVEVSCRKLYEVGELKQRVKRAYQKMKDCRLCPHHCGVNRLKNEKGYCRVGSEIRVASYGPHFGEEPPLVGSRGSGTIFFSNCNLKCVYCQNFDISQIDTGTLITITKLAEVMVSLQEKGCHNINFVTPSHMIHSLLAATYLACRKGLSIPLVYNSGGYDDPEALQLLEGVIDIYMPDIKYADDKIALKYSGIENYFSTVKKAVKEMYNQVGDLQTEKGIARRGLLVRHLILPSDLAGTEKIMKFIAEEISKKCYVNLMDQYYPAHKAHKYPELNHKISHRRYRQVLKAAKEAGLNNVGAR